MNWAHVHLILNHIPVLGTGFSLLLLVFAMIKRSEELKKTSLGIFVIVAVMTLPVYFTGEPAEEVVEHLPGVSDPIIHEHEESAEVSLAAVEILGLVALVGLFRFRRLDRLPNWFVTTALVISIVVSGLMARTANLGGKVHHPEIRSASQSATSTGGLQAEEKQDED